MDDEERQSLDEVRQAIEYGIKHRQETIFHLAGPVIGTFEDSGFVRQTCLRCNVDLAFYTTEDLADVGENEAFMIATWKPGERVFIMGPYIGVAEHDPGEPITWALERFGERIIDPMERWCRYPVRNLEDE